VELASRVYFIHDEGILILQHGKGPWGAFPDLNSEHPRHQKKKGQILSDSRVSHSIRKFPSKLWDHLQVFGRDILK
jgi:hypothetical protein